MQQGFTHCDRLDLAFSGFRQPGRSPLLRLVESRRIVFAVAARDGAVGVGGGAGTRFRQHTFDR